MLITALFAKVRAYFRYRSNMRCLERLTDRQLSDIGIARGNIPGIAQDIAFR